VNPSAPPAPLPGPPKATRAGAQEIRLTSPHPYGPSINIASYEYLVFGGRDLGGLGSFTPCLLNDVRIYRIALSQAEVLALLPASPAPKLASRNAGASGLRISWPTDSFGHQLQTSPSPTGAWTNAALTVAVEGTERAAYAPVAASAQFFRLAK
jgi:hypothetical protein